MESRIPGLPRGTFDVRFGALRMPRSLLVTLLCLATLAVAFATSAALTTACTTHQCDSAFVNIDQATGTMVGSMQVLQPSTGLALWESSPVEGQWINFPGNLTYFFALPPNFTPLAPPSAAVATDDAPFDSDSGGGTSTTASGQLAEFGGYVNGGFLVTNASCADYRLFVSVWGTVPVATQDAGTTDAGTTDGSSTDAGSTD